MHKSTDVVRSNLQDAVDEMNLKKLRKLLDQVKQDENLLNEIGPNLLHSSSIISSSPSPSRLDAIYMLCQAGIDIDAADDAGLSPLAVAAHKGDAELCEVLLQCGADMFHERNGIPLLEEVDNISNGKGLPISSLLPTPSHHSHYAYQPLPPDGSAFAEGASCVDPEAIPVPSSPRAAPFLDKLLYEHETWNGGPCIPCFKKVLDVFLMYRPGLWRAVENEDVNQVRKLVNLWCNIDIRKSGQSLVQRALQTGNEGIFHLILSVEPTMNLVFSVLADDMIGVQSLLKEKLPLLNLDLRKLSHRGAPLMYFPIRRQRVGMVRELVKNGASIATHLLDDEGVDMPVLYSALQPDINPEVVRELLPSSECGRETLKRLSYRGLNALHAAVRNGVDVWAVKAVLEAGGPVLLSSRNCNNETPRDVAVHNGRRDYVTVIDEIVHSWICSPEKYPDLWRDILVLRGYEPMIVEGVQDIMVDNIEGDHVTQFMSSVLFKQVQVAKLCRAAEEGDVQVFTRCLKMLSENISTASVIEESRPKGDGMSCLHLAVLNNQKEIVRTAVVDECTGLCVDNVLDQFHRTPFHYAEGMQDEEQIQGILRNAGCSEHTLDMDGKEPLDFREARGTPAMESMLHKLRNKDYSATEVNIWDRGTLRKHTTIQRKQRFKQYNECSRETTTTYQSAVQLRSNIARLAPKEEAYIYPTHLSLTEEDLSKLDNSDISFDEDDDLEGDEDDQKYWWCSIS